MAQGDLAFRSVDLAALGLGAYTCPYGLPPVDRAPLLLLVSGWLKRFEGSGTASVMKALDVLHQRFDRIVGLDQMDAFALDTSDAVLDRIDLLLKVNGLYKDRELYRYPVGALSRSGNWSHKDGPARFAYKRENLDKLRLSVPCFVSNIPLLRRRTRILYRQPWTRRAIRASGDSLLGAAASWPRHGAPRLAAHFLGGLTHPQRADAVRRLKHSGLAWRGGISAVPLGTPQFSAAELAQLGRQLVQEQLLVPRQNRVSYMLGMLGCKAVLSITGIGEICFRMAEAWAMRRVLVCQDLSHVDCLFPLISGENVLFCRPDLSDLEDVLRGIDASYAGYERMARKGHEAWRAWCATSGQVIRRGFAPLYETAS